MFLRHFQVFLAQGHVFSILGDGFVVDRCNWTRVSAAGCFVPDVKASAGHLHHGSFLPNRPGSQKGTSYAMRVPVHNKWCQSLFHTVTKSIEIVL